VDNNYLDLGMNKSGFIHTLPSGRLISISQLLNKNIKFAQSLNQLALVCPLRTERINVILGALLGLGVVIYIKRKGSTNHKNQTHNLSIGVTKFSEPSSIAGSRHGFPWASSFTNCRRASGLAARLLANDGVMEIVSIPYFFLVTRESHY
jgi:hypothetical protein